MYLRLKSPNDVVCEAGVNRRVTFFKSQIEKDIGYLDEVPVKEKIPLSICVICTKQHASTCFSLKLGIRSSGQIPGKQEIKLSVFDTLIS